MTTFFIFFGLFGAIIVAVSIAGYRYSSMKQSTKTHDHIIEQGDDLKNRIDSTSEEVIDNKNKISTGFDELKEKVDTTSNKTIKSINDTIHNKKSNVDLTSVYYFKIVDRPNSTTFAELNVALQNNSNETAENALLLLTIEYPENILNGGYHSGQNFFANNKAQLYTDFVYPGIINQFEKVKIKPFDQLYMNVTIVAQNMKKKRNYLVGYNLPRSG